ncbi:50S ribosomal protein L25 [Bacteroidales bacterium OttesenSCG-928-K03]|nr:50S ribosomal protein L25 [Odoribacter sp. OttesenSCG-928-L07]MDL2239652.1 50S ribosomal protein L25 [Bacteroidales bacterium OttesenSCG-928-L14]MDL2243015.1 50S ribosomal protein L25 [Bacteroidales bacterium OttesenSCG-928-K03]
MKSISLSGSLRKNVGKKDSRQIRKDEMIPAVIYGGNEQYQIILSEKEFGKVIFTPETYIVNVNIDGKTVQTILKDIQYHPVSDRVLHADLYEISETKPFTVSLPIILTGTSKGVLRGGKLQQRMRKIRVNGLLHNIPDCIEIDITDLDAGSPIRIEDVDVKYENLKFVDSKRNVIVDIKSSRSMTSDEEGAEEEK